MSLAVSAAASSRVTSSCYATHNEEPIAAVRFPGHGLVAQMRIESVAIGRGLHFDPWFRATCQDQQAAFPWPVRSWCADLPPVDRMARGGTGQVI
jgi:hypothetical protein